jgi:lipopolysaccharide transport system ATP-binding protein
MSNIAIRVEGVSKLYALGQIGTGTISRDIERWWTTRVRGKEDPFAKIGQTNDRTVKAESDFVWSLKDVDFEVQKGEVVGIIGRNGAGKSTLLKILSKITSPTTGQIHVNGRIASLLEVGTGFHPEMTGRENVFMNGAILGMRKKEIEKKFDEIVDFAGVAAYVDTPVKRYSSGMTVRLGFAVAAFLEPEILIVDEVLAVGDAEFQKKCIGRMKDASQQEGRTVLFVSHNLGAVSSLCNTGLLLHNGEVVLRAPIQHVLNSYSSMKSASGKGINEETFAGPLNTHFQLNQISINNQNPLDESLHLNPQEDLHIELNVTFTGDNPIRVAIGITKDDVRIVTLLDTPDYVNTKGQFKSTFVIPGNLLRPGYYYIGIGAIDPLGFWVWGDSVFAIELTEVFGPAYEKVAAGIVNFQHQTKTKRESL